MEVFIVGEESQLPEFAHPDDAGCDLRSDVDDVLWPGESKLISTGIRIGLPSDMAAFVHPRSGLALKNGITVLNAPGTIDAGYTGVIGVIMFNTSSEPFFINRGDRIAQLVFQKIERPTFAHVTDLDNTTRGNGGFGSTGKA